MQNTHYLRRRLRLWLCCCWFIAVHEIQLLNSQEVYEPKSSLKSAVVSVYLAAEIGKCYKSRCFAVVSESQLPVHQCVEHQLGNLRVWTLALISWLIYRLPIWKISMFASILYMVLIILNWEDFQWKDQETRLKFPKKNAKYSQIHIVGFIYPGSWTSILQTAS